MEERVYNPRIVCADGFSMSVQAAGDWGSYCTPRTDAGPHTHMEGGFPTMIPGKELLEYAEGGEFKDPCDTVYPYVPREVFEREFEAHGGIVEGSLPY